MITYEVGDATVPFERGRTLIIHVVNNVGLWGSGFVVPLGKKYPKAREKFLDHVGHMQLGKTDFVTVESYKLVIANMCAQNGVRSDRNPHPLKYGPLATCIDHVCYYAAKNSYRILAPKFGSDLAGGSWPKIESIFYEALDTYQVEATVRTLP